MGALILFFTGLAMALVWWLSTRRLAVKPWLEQGTPGEWPEVGVPSIPRAKLGLTVLLASISVLFALFISAYLMRMQLADWRAVPKPALLWANTGLLMISSAALQWARSKAHRGEERVTGALLSAAGAALAFAVGQAVAWRQLVDGGYGLRFNPASSFFFLITALHAIHVLGGIVGLGRVAIRASKRESAAKLRLGIDLCSLYWDFLLLMWLVLFGLLLLS